MILDVISKIMTHKMIHPFLLFFREWYCKQWLVHVLKLHVQNDLDGDRLTIRKYIKLGRFENDLTAEINKT